LIHVTPRQVTTHHNAFHLQRFKSLDEQKQMKAKITRKNSKIIHHFIASTATSAETKLKNTRKLSNNHSPTNSFHTHHRNFISKNTIAIPVTSSSSSSAAFCFANITASPQHSRKGGKNMFHHASSLIK
jgi:hypothetical protein